MVFQISVFLENKPNRLYSFTKVLNEADINLRAAMIAETGEFGIVRAIVDDPDAAYDVLKKNNFTVKKTQVVGVEVDDAPGNLSEIARVLGDDGINIIYIYAFSISGQNKAFLILKTDNITRSRDVLADKLGLRIITQEDIIKL